ncbi:O-antigen ligase family protein [Paracoccaceae bacterium]|nr:O-antigen ligase family protein [Paracoccaceae bacterium]
MVDFDFMFIRRFVLTMLWYTVAINGIVMIKPEVIFRILCAVGIFSAISMLADTEKTLFSYIFEDRRYHSEGEGGDLNINNITLILVSLAATASVLKKNIGYMRYSNALMVSLFLSVGLVLLIGSTRSAIAFYLLLIFYNFYNIRSKAMFKAMFVLILFLVGFSFSVIQFGDDFLFVGRFLDNNYMSSQRTLMSLSSLSVFADNPIFGFGGIDLVALQSDKFYSQDHNFYTKMLGSKGVIGFLFVMLFYIGMTKSVARKIPGIYILKGLFFYIFIFSPAGPGTLIIAALIHYLSDLQVNRSLKRS